MNENRLYLYVVTDRRLAVRQTVEEQVEQAILGGATFVQLREKTCSDAECLDFARKVKQVTDRYHVPFVLNDRVEVARAVDADGVHVGQSDMALTQARAVLGPEKIIGVSASTVGQALAAETGGADYLGVGAVFPTGTKPDADTVSLETLREITQKVSLPVVAIGGINQETAPKLRDTGIAGIAVVSAVFGAPDIRAAAQVLSCWRNG